MTEPAAPAATRRPWRRLAAGLILFALAPMVPAARVALPIEQTLLLLVAAVAVCAIVAWKQGGRISFAIIWTVLATILLVSPAGPAGSPYDLMARGWTLLIAASFGLVSIMMADASFLPRALSALAVATAVGFALVLASPGGPSRVTAGMAQEFQRRNDQSLAALRQVNRQPGWREMVEKSPTLQRLTEDSEIQLEAIRRMSIVVMPAILALESLAALALGWALFHRMSRTAIGPALGRLRDFRFNDHLVWGVAVGASIFLLQAFAEGRNAGLNLLVFFGFLYVLRGMGILAWMSRTRAMNFLLVALLVFAWPVVGALAFVLGLGDTWLDLRSRMQARM